MATLEDYNKIKASHKDSIVLMRCGDWYKTYSEDAKSVSFELGITLNKENGIPTACFPAYYLDMYLPVLVRKGNRVGICDD